MKLKPTPKNTVVHTPTEEEAKELLAILHENGYKWYCSGKEEGWENFGDETCYRINTHDNVYHTCDREWYETTCKYCRLPILTLAEFKELYCEMTEQMTEKAEESSVIHEKPQPKFEVGDWVIHNHKNRELGQIVAYYPDEKFCYAVRFGKEYHNMAEHQLLPSTEPESTPTEDMETKENRNLSQDVANCDKAEDKQLNLCELLKGHEGEPFFSLAHGDVKLDHVSPTIDSCIVVKKRNGDIEHFYRNGRWLRDGIVMLFPSRALYEQYPLDPYTAWMTWQEEQKTYEIKITIDYCENFMGVVDDINLIFRTPADRDKCLSEIKAIIEKYSKK